MHLEVNNELLERSMLPRRSEGIESPEDTSEYLGQCLEKEKSLVYVSSEHNHSVPLRQLLYHLNTLALTRMLLWHETLLATLTSLALKD